MKEIFAYVNARYLNGKGQGIVEYALILAFVIAVAAALLSGGGIREAVTNIFKDVTDKLNGTPSGGATGTGTGT